jgi:hypothetical protein
MLIFLHQILRWFFAKLPEMGQSHLLYLSLALAEDRQDSELELSIALMEEDRRDISSRMLGTAVHSPQGFPGSHPIARDSRGYDTYKVMLPCLQGPGSASNGVPKRDPRR